MTYVSRGVPGQLNATSRPRPAPHLAPQWAFRADAAARGAPRPDRKAGIAVDAAQIRRT